MTNKNQDIFNKVLWFEKRLKFDIDFFDQLLPQRIVSKKPKYKSGKFYSEKCGRDIQYESGLELEFIKQLEQSERVLFYFEQPVKIPYRRIKRKQTYTPDFGVLLDTKEFVLIEIKDLPGMLENSVQKKTEGLIDFCSTKGFGLLLTDGKETIDKIRKVKLNRKLEKDILDLIEYGVIRKNQYTELMKNHNATQKDILKIVLKNNLRFNSFPVKIQKGGKNEIFHHVFANNKRYEDFNQPF